MMHRLVVAFTSVMIVSLVGNLVEAAGVASEHGGTDSNLGFLFAAFAVTWAGFFGYVFYVALRQRDLRREVRALRRALEEREESEQSPPQG